MKRKRLFIVSAIVILIVIVSFVAMSINKRPEITNNSINGTYVNVDNQFDWISFNEKTSYYVEYNHGENGDKQIVYEGEFQLENNEVDITSGEYKGYSLTLENDKLSLESNENTYVFKRKSDVPTEIIELE